MKVPIDVCVSSALTLLFIVLPSPVLNLPHPSPPSSAPSSLAAWPPAPFSTVDPTTGEYYLFSGYGPIPGALQAGWIRRKLADWHGILLHWPEPPSPPVPAPPIPPARKPWRGFNARLRSTPWISMALDPVGDDDVEDAARRLRFIMGEIEEFGARALQCEVWGSEREMEAGIGTAVVLGIVIGEASLTEEEEEEEGGVSVG